MKKNIRNSEQLSYSERVVLEINDNKEAEIMKIAIGCDPNAENENRHS